MSPLPFQSEPLIPMIHCCEPYALDAVEGVVCVYIAQAGLVHPLLVTPEIHLIVPVGVMVDDFLVAVFLSGV